MRRLTTLIFAASLGLSTQAIAGSYFETSGYAVTQERGVIVYRGAHPVRDFGAIAAAQTARKNAAQIKVLRSQLQKQEKALAAQKQANAELKTEIENAQTRSEKSECRPRYGRPYFGNNRFFGPNGFAGNSNFSGANAVGPVRRSHYRRNVHPQR